MCEGKWLWLKTTYTLSIQSEQNPLENAMHPRNETTVTKQLEFLPRNCTGKASCAASKENRVQKTRVHIPPGLQDWDIPVFLSMSAVAPLTFLLPFRQFCTKFERAPFIYSFHKNVITIMLKGSALGCSPLRALILAPHQALRKTGGILCAHIFLLIPLWCWTRTRKHNHICKRVWITSNGKGLFYRRSTSSSSSPGLGEERGHTSMQS